MKATGDSSAKELNWATRITRPPWIRRCSWTLAVLLVILFVDFAILHLPQALTDFDPSSGTRLDADALERRHAALRERFQLDEPLLGRFGSWLGRALRFDFGPSMVEPRSVREMIGAALPATLLLQSCAFFLMFGLGVPFGVWMSARGKSRFDRGARGSLYALQSIPDFWLATLFIIFLATSSGFALFPLEGLSDRDAASWSWGARFLDTLHHLVLPVAVLTLPGFALIARVTRNVMMEELTRDWVRSARAQGIAESRILWRFALKNAMVPIATLFGAVLPGLIGGSVVVERIFNIHGMGSLAFESTLARDFPVLQALLLMTAVITLAGYAISDVAVGWLDPRTRQDQNPWHEVPA